ncbi:Y+L amino acid transporter 2 [Nematostella vectensis]|uniref:Y+L amino acid transporter 2 n=1 Tax=Nematostella vectensis TaxID=45351 RepID=UPI002077907D|nr:Y+L amino acid transporter 2 [Nematostella vectensis]
MEKESLDTSNPEFKIESGEKLRKAQDKFTLKRMLGIAGSSAMVAGIMIGSGIFISARWVLVYSGSVGMAMLLWALCGQVAFVGGLCWVELALTFPKCGGEYMIIKQTLGSPLAFSIVWLKLIIVIPCSSAITALTFSAYAIEPFFRDCFERDDLEAPRKILAAFTLCFITYVNVMSAKVAARVQNVFTVGKTLALVMIIITGLVRLARDKGSSTNNFDEPFDGTTSVIGRIGLAFQAGLWAFEGWDALNDVSEEVKNPRRNMPLAVLGSISGVTAIYFLVNIAYFAVLTSDEVKESPATGVAFAAKMYGSFDWIIPVCVACSVFGSQNASTFTSGRIFFAAAREGHLPSFLAMIHRTKRTPVPSLLFQNIIACLLLIPAKATIASLTSVFSFGEWFTYTITVVGLLWTRYRRPGLRRPFKLPILVPVLFFLMSVYLALSPAVSAPMESLWSFLLLMSGIPVYYVLIHWKLAPKCISRMLDSFAYKVQKVLDVVYPDTDVRI